MRLLAFGERHTVALSLAGQLYIWGSSEYGQCGLGNYSTVVSPLLLDLQSPVIRVACGSFHTLAQTVDHGLLSWGCGSQGQLGHGRTSPEPTPKPILALQDKEVITFACGHLHNLVQTTTGLYSWGYDGKLALGQHTGTDGPK